MKQFTKTASSLLRTLSLAGLVLQASISSRTTLRTLEVPEASKGPGIQAPGQRWLVYAPSRPPLGDRRWARNGAGVSALLELNCNVRRDRLRRIGHRAIALVSTSKLSMVGTANLGGREVRWWREKRVEWLNACA